MVKSVSKDLNQTLLSDAATDADIDAIWEDYFSNRSSKDLDTLDLRYQLKDQMTREEWQQVFHQNETGVLVVYSDAKRLRYSIRYFSSQPR